VTKAWNVVGSVVWLIDEVVACQRATGAPGTRATSSGTRTRPKVSRTSGESGSRGNRETATDGAREEA